MPKKPTETIATLVARVQLPPALPRVNGGPPKLNNVTAADIARLNADRSIENKIMNARDPWGAQPSEKNRASQMSFASLNEGLTFTGISTSPYSNSNYMKSRRVG